MRDLSATEVLELLAQRMEMRADILERVSQDGYTLLILELRRFAEMTRKAKDYLEGKSRT